MGFVLRLWRAPLLGGFVSLSPFLQLKCIYMLALLFSLHGWIRPTSWFIVYILLYFDTLENVEFFVGHFV